MKNYRQIWERYCPIDTFPSDYTRDANDTVLVTFGGLRVALAGAYQEAFKEGQRDMCFNVMRLPAMPGIRYPIDDDVVLP